MRIPRIKLFVLALVAVAGATATVALASPNRAADNRSAVQNAFVKTSKVASGQFAFTLKISGGGSSTIGVSGTGAFDSKHKVSVVSINLGPLSQVLGGAAGGVDVPQTLQVVSIGNTAYVHLPSVAAQVKKGAEWLKFDSTTATKSLPGGVKPATTVTNPQQALKVLNASITVHRVGTTTVRGSSTTHYLVTADVTKVVNGLVAKADRASTLKQLKAAGIKTVALDVYVDGSGLVRRVSGGLKSLKVQKGTPPVAVSFSVDIYGIGHPVKATAPPAAKTADGAKLLEQLLAGLGNGTGG